MKLSVTKSDSDGFKTFAGWCSKFHRQINVHLREHSKPCSCKLAMQRHILKLYAYSANAAVLSLHLLFKNPALSCILSLICSSCFDDISTFT